MSVLSFRNLKLSFPLFHSRDRRNAQKREAAVISPDNIKMPLETEDSTKGDSGEGELRKLLDTELSLDNSDLRSHAWYHGSISRARAEEVCAENGNFIIRDCISQPGDFVLTCRWNNQTIHVIIQKTIIQPNTIYERIQYKLEDEAYDTIPDLVTAYVGSKRPVTILSGAKICTPVNRTAPLSYYLSKYAAQAEHTRLHGTLSRPAAKSTPPPKPSSYLKREPVAVGCSIIRTSPPRGRKDFGSLNRAQRPSSGTFEGNDYKCFKLLTLALFITFAERLTHSGDGVLGSSSSSNSGSDKNNTFTSNSLPRRLNSTSLSLPPQPLSQDAPPEKNVQASKVENTSSLENPPPKPSRVPSVKVKPQRPGNITNPGERVYAEIDEDDETPVYDEKEILSSVSKTDDISFNEKAAEKANEFSEFSNMRHSRLSEVYQPSGSDSGNGSGDSVQTSASDSRNRDSQASFGDSGFILAEDDSVTEEESLLIIPDMCPPSAFDLESFSTLLLPSIENRPLDATAFKGIKNTLTESGSRILAAHLTKIDLDLLNGPQEKDLGLGITMGVELITLPQGSQLRKDLIERTECLKLLVAVSILKVEDLNERAEMIYRWIQIAIDTKTAMGNLYGFTGIMLGLCVPEVQRLTQTWHIVRQKYTDSAFKFESKLRSTLKSMNECSNPQAPNTTIPHILPYILLCERDLEDIYSLHTKGSSLFQWESTASDYGLQMLYSHLQEGRMFTQNLTLYKRNAELLLGDMKHMDELTLDMFRL
ncbi:Breast cancer anti-estrogen resistance protein 3-like protein [Armadillidium vulgare]|nr:Breast cancer anti-estrogen resistance protein 3-like protein [Armadillidium vulgare]